MEAPELKESIAQHLDFDSDLKALEASAVITDSEVSQILEEALSDPPGESRGEEGDS